MKSLLIIDIILIIVLFIIGINTIIKLKKSEGKKIEDIKNDLLKRVDMIIVLTILISIITIVNIFISR